MQRVTADVVVESRRTGRRLETFLQ